MQQQNEFHGIERTINNYFQGMYQRDLSLLQGVFHPDACLFGFIMGGFERLNLEAWLQKVSEMPIPSESGEAFAMKIVALDRTGDTATVKAEVLYHGLQFTDYLSLLKQNGHWLIVNKTFSHR
ncbi:MAG: nuclear transport factor 2 family protein [Enterobacteriaceae bacterium]